ncbi:MAG: helix-turn-helix domain-containing protein [Actinomycetales bacterium]|nr:MAG: helix-turn-helix domain-containing protein [Actinomycetales bacterium]
MIIVTPADLGTLVRNRRLERDETQVAVARRAAISRDSLIRIEQGHPRVELGKALAVVEALGITLDSTDAERPSAADRSSDALLDQVFENLTREE